jgi:hypothetical protein
MKRLLIFASLILMLVPSVEARRKRDKAGRIDKDTYTDEAYGFNIKMNEGWKVKINDADDPMRLVLIQKNYLIPTDYADAPDYTKVPRIVVYADTSSLPASTFIDSLVSPTYETDQTKEIKKEFEILWEQQLVPKGEDRFDIAGERGAIWRAQAKYMKEVATSASSIGGKRVYGSYGGAIIGVKKGDTIILFHVMSEWQYFNDVLKDAMEFVNSLTWADAKKK